MSVTDRWVRLVRWLIVATGLACPLIAMAGQYQCHIRVVKLGGVDVEKMDNVTAPSRREAVCVAHAAAGLPGRCDQSTGPVTCYNMPAGSVPSGATQPSSPLPPVAPKPATAPTGPHLSWLPHQNSGLCAEQGNTCRSACKAAAAGPDAIYRQISCARQCDLEKVQCAQRRYYAENPALMPMCASVGGDPATGVCRGEAPPSGGKAP